MRPSLASSPKLVRKLIMKSYCDNILITLAVFLFTATAFSIEGGTTVGDGGFAVACSDRIEILDLYEHRFFNGEYRITLDQNGDSIKEMVGEGLNRIKNKYSLNEQQHQLMQTAAYKLLRFPFDPLHSGLRQMYGFFLQSPKTVVYKNVWKSVQDQRCVLETVIVRPPRTSQHQKVYHSICQHNYSEFEFCFFTNMSIYRRLDRDQRACLVLHEVIRYSDFYKDFKDEIEMRKAIAEICTQ